ncbi:MAG: NrfD/PsrC family molybdoenzyme membrane anchor subunit [Elusimicrobiota bacterium]|jgi:predicted membrane protein
MDPALFHSLHEVLGKVVGFIYPNEIELQWSILIVLYPYITGLVAGAFILASLERVFNVEAVKPTYRLALLTALAFLIVAPLPLNLHLGHPERAFNILFTPNPSSAMAMFGFVYLWYLMAVLLLEVWLDYRKDIVEWSKSDPIPFKRFLYKIGSFGVDNVSPRSLEIDDKLGKALTIIGLPSAVLLHGYVGFIFGSIKANPWWSTPLMPVIFLFSAMASGIAAVLLLYMVSSAVRRKPVSMACLDTIGKYFLTAIILAFSLEILETLQKAYEAEEHFDILSLMVEGRLFVSMVLIQGVLGALAPMALLSSALAFRPRESVRKAFYAVSACLSLIGIFAMRWNVVMGGQLFSKSLRGFTTYKIELIGREGWLAAGAVVALPFLILAILLYFLPPWEREAPETAGSKS